MPQSSGELPGYIVRDQTAANQTVLAALRSALRRGRGWCHGRDSTVSACHTRVLWALWSASLLREEGHHRQPPRAPARGLPRAAVRGRGRARDDALAQPVAREEAEAVV
eukprot:scaffold4663_cov54-Phaeocystis_antarctica.AAC.1